MPPPTIPSRGGPSQARKGMAHATGGKGKGGGKHYTTGAPKRHRKIMRDTINGITKPDIRRLARRGGVKRISATIYDEARTALKARIRLASQPLSHSILHDCVAYVEYRNAKTVTVHDVIFSLKRIGQPIYGFDPDTYNGSAKKSHA